MELLRHRHWLCGLTISGANAASQCIDNPPWMPWQTRRRHGGRRNPEERHPGAIPPQQQPIDVPQNDQSIAQVKMRDSTSGKEPPSSGPTRISRCSQATFNHRYYDRANHSSQPDQWSSDHVYLVQHSYFVCAPLVDLMLFTKQQLISLACLGPNSRC